MVKSRKKLIIPTILIVMIFFVILILIYFFCNPIKEKNYREIMKGNFSSIEAEEDLRVELETIYESQKKTQDMEWITFDLNQDGKKELVWRKKETSSLPMGYITAIFADTQENCKLILTDFSDDSEFYSLDNSHLVYYREFLWLYQYGSFAEYKLNEKFEMEKSSELEVYIIPSFEFLLNETTKEWLNDLIKEYPFIEGEGNYFKITTYHGNEEKEEMVTEEVWKKAVDELIGKPLTQARPYLQELMLP